MTLEDIQRSIAALLDAEQTPPAPETEDWRLRRGLVNLVQRDWAETHDWAVLYKEVITHASSSTGYATIPLPADFRKLAGYPQFNGTEYSEISPRERERYTSTDEFIYILGTPGSYKMIVHPASLVSGASIYYSYYSSPASLVSTADVSPVPDPNYLVQATLAKLWLIDEDPRVQIAQAEASRILERMLVAENTRGEAYWDRIKTIDETRRNFAWGRD